MALDVWSPDAGLIKTAAEIASIVIIVVNVFINVVVNAIFVVVNIHKTIIAINVIVIDDMCLLSTSLLPGKYNVVEGGFSWFLGCFPSYSWEFLDLLKSVHVGIYTQMAKATTLMIIFSDSYLDSTPV